MPRPSLDPKIHSIIEKTWVSMKEPSAAEVHKKIRQDKGDVVGLRKVQMVIADLKERRANDVPDHQLRWRPWQLETETPEETDYLLELRRQGETVGAGTFSVTQAEWAKRIRVSLKEMHILMVPYLVSAIYDGRQNFSNLIARPETFFTDDMDQYLAYKPWVSSSRRNTYDQALKNGKVKYPIPFFMGSAFEKLDPESRLQMIKQFGLPERLAKMSIDELASTSKLPFEEIDFLFRVGGLLGSMESLISYANVLINAFHDPNNDTNPIPGFGGN